MGVRSVAAAAVYRDGVVELMCPECGCRWQTSPRNARRLRDGELEHRGLCHRCRGPSRPIAVDDQTRAWWLEQLTDREIAEAAEAMFGEADRGHIAAERARLLAE